MLALLVMHRSGKRRRSMPQVEEWAGMRTCISRIPLAFPTFLMMIILAPETASGADEAVSIFLRRATSGKKLRESDHGTARKMLNEWREGKRAGAIWARDSRIENFLEQAVTKSYLSASGRNAASLCLGNIHRNISRPNPNVRQGAVGADRNRVTTTSNLAQTRGEFNGYLFIGAIGAVVFVLLLASYFFVRYIKDRLIERT